MDDEASHIYYTIEVEVVRDAGGKDSIDDGNDKHGRGSNISKVSPRLACRKVQQIVGSDLR